MSNENNEVKGKAGRPEIFPGQETRPLTGSIPATTSRKLKQFAAMEDRAASVIVNEALQAYFSENADNLRMAD